MRHISSTVSGCRHNPMVAECPEPLRQVRVLPAPGCPQRDTSEGVTPPSSLLRAHAPVHPPPGIFSLSLYARSLTGCCQPLLPDGPSRHYLCNPYRDDWTSTPRCPFSAYTRFFLKGIGHHVRSTRSAHRVPPALQLQQGRVFGAAVIPSCSVSSVC